MAVQARVTVEEFEAIAELPENRDKRLEFIGGEIVEVVSNYYSSEIGATFLAEIKVYARVNKLGRVTGADGGYKVSGERYIPDVGFISSARQPKPSRESWNSNAPDLAVEVISPTDKPKDVTDKVMNYVAAGTVVWLVYPDEKQVKVYEPGQPVKTYTVKDELDGGRVLPGFKLSLKDVFVE